MGEGGAVAANGIRNYLSMVMVMVMVLSWP